MGLYLYNFVVVEIFCNFERYIYVTKRLISKTESMANVDIIKCQGSGNDFILVDCVANEALAAVDWRGFARVACDRERGIGSDGILLVVRYDDGCYGMDMLNPDGTHAEMCGNGIRCVARYAMERGYIASNGLLRSGGRDYNVAEAEAIGEGIPTYSVDIPIRTSSPDFAFFDPMSSFLGRRIEALDDELEFTALNLGNPHIVAKVDTISLEHLVELGERVKKLKALFPNGVNVSLYECRGPRNIFVATYERGAGITLSCGTAMTASATASALLGYVVRGERIEVRNRGGKVYCTTLLGDDIVTRLEGNASFEWRGVARFEEDAFDFDVVAHSGEEEAWARFVESINR